MRRLIQAPGPAAMRSAVPPTGSSAHHPGNGRWALRSAMPAATSPGRRLADLKAAAGLALVAAGIALLSAQRPFPGWWALLPVGGTALLIAAGPGAWINRRILSNPA